MISPSRLTLGARCRLGTVKPLSLFRRNHIAATRLGLLQRNILPVFTQQLNGAGNSGGTTASCYYYSTERAVELRSGRTDLKTLYDASRETENCGVGLIASLKSVPSRDIVEKADEMLVRMAHRGGCGCDPASGDGSGTCTLLH